MIGFFISSIPRKILASLVAIYAVTYLATAAIVYFGVRASIVESNAAALDQVAEVKYERLVNLFTAYATDLAAWSRLEVMNDLVSGDIDKRVTRTLEDLKQLYRLSGELYAFDLSGRLVASTRAVRDVGQANTLPQGWRTPGDDLFFVDRHPDPIAGGQTIALAIPVFASFNKTYRVGTLVLTSPWPEIEKLLFSGETGTLLVDSSDPAHILAADPPRLENPAVRRELIIGRSTNRLGLVRNWQVETFEETSVVTRSLRHVGVELALLGIALGLPILGLGRWLSDRLTEPVLELTRVATEIADTDKLSARVPVSSSDELGTLARAFNRMTVSLEGATRERERFVQELEKLNQTLETKVTVRTKELEAAVAAQRRLIGDISHEIKSPLARLGVALGLARRSEGEAAARQFDRIEREIGNVSALASELLTLARLDGAQPVAVGPVDLCALVEEIVADAIFESPQRRTDLVLREPRAAVILPGNADLLRRAVENVVRNALFYTAPGTSIDIVIGRRARSVIVEVHDYGPGVPEAALPHLFEPFYRVDEARARKTGGSGVGLAICQRVVALHGGSIEARNNRPSGLIVAIQLPLPGAGPDALATNGELTS